MQISSPLDQILTTVFQSFNDQCLNSRRKQQKSYPSFGTDSSHMIDATDSLITVNENIDQNVELE